MPRALLGFGLDSGIEAIASVVVVWRFTGSRLTSPRSERRAQQLVSLSFLLLSPYIAIEGIRSLLDRERPLTSIIRIALTAGTVLLEPPLGLAKRRLGNRLGSAATGGEGTQNLLCAWLALAVLASLIANTVWGWWWLNGTVALIIAGWALVEARRSWRGDTCACATPVCDLTQNIRFVATRAGEAADQ